MIDIATQLHQHIQKIAAIQSENTEHFPIGLIPSFRINDGYRYRRCDTNLFFTAITLFTIETVKHDLSHQLKQTHEEMLTKARLLYPRFRNKDGLDTYNFYQTKPSQHFPHGKLLYRFEHFRLPDDVDDTAMVYLTTEPTEAQLHFLKTKLSLHANLTTRQIQNTYPEYRNLRAYSTWFGKNMYVEFDACVLSNLLYCIFRYRLPLNQHDEDSMTFIRSVVETGRYRREPFRCAHSYPRAPLILYHIARLVAAFEPDALQKIRPLLIRDGFELLQEDLSVMDRLLVCTSLHRLGETPDLIDTESISDDDLQRFSFFIAGMLTAYECAWLYRLADIPLVRMNWVCEAHSRALVVEYLVVSGQAGNA